jgi:hypothetical protein
MEKTCSASRRFYLSRFRETTILLMDQARNRLDSECSAVLFLKGPILGGSFKEAVRFSQYFGSHDESFGNKSRGLN